MVARPRRLGTVLGVCDETVILCGGLTFAPVLSPQVTTAASIVLVGFFGFEREDLFSRRKLFIPALQRRYGSLSSPSCPRSEFKQQLALMNGCIYLLVN